MTAALVEQSNGQLMRRSFVKGIGGAALTALLGCQLSSGGSVSKPHVGYFTTGTRNDAVSGPRADAFAQGLRELGHIEGESIVIDWRFANERPDTSLSALAEELVNLPVQVIVAALTEPLVGCCARHAYHSDNRLPTASEPQGPGTGP